MKISVSFKNIIVEIICVLYIMLFVYSALSKLLEFQNFQAQLVEEREAKIVKFIYDLYLKDTPLYIIKQKAKELGFNRSGNTAVERVLTNATYAGLLKVEAYKEHPGGLFPGIHEPIIDTSTWQMVQRKMEKPRAVKFILDDEIPLRGILKCHCGNLLTGAPSRGKSGKYFYYYKCRYPKHNNISALKAHSQLLDAFKLMSLSDKMVADIKNGCNMAMQRELKDKKERLKSKKTELIDIEEKLHALEEKWISNEISRETYNRWHSNYSYSVLNIKGAIERLSINTNEVFDLLKKNIDLLTDIPYVYSKSTTLQKREFVSMVFDTNLYYKEGVYRTPTMMDVFSGNVLKMKDKGCLFYEKKRDDLKIIPSSGVAGNRTRVQTSN